MGTNAAIIQIMISERYKIFQMTRRNCDVMPYANIGIPEIELQRNAFLEFELPWKSLEKWTTGLNSTKKISSYVIPEICIENEFICMESYTREYLDNIDNVLTHMLYGSFLDVK